MNNVKKTRNVTDAFPFSLQQNEDGHETHDTSLGLFILIHTVLYITVLLAASALK